MESKKRIDINKYKEQLKDLTYTELNSKAIEIAFGLMGTYPNTWKDHLKTNRMHSACIELMAELSV